MGNRWRRTVGWSLALLAPVVLLWLATSAPVIGAGARSVLTMVGIGAVVVDLALLALLVVVSRGADDREGGAEEPLLQRMRLPSRVRDRPVLGVVGLEPEAGASTIALNAAVAIALDGRLEDGRRPLPACLLSEGTLTQRIGISGEGLREAMRRHPGGLDDDLLSHARRVAGCVDVFCIPHGEVGGGRLARLVQALRREYDAVVIDCAAGDRFLAAAIADQADLLLACIPSPRGAIGEEAERAAARILAGRTSKAVLIVNRQFASGAFQSLHPDFFYRAELPEDPAVERCDRAGRPWVLWRSSPAADRLRRIVAELLPKLRAGEVDDAA